MSPMTTVYTCDACGLEIEGGHNGLYRVTITDFRFTVSQPRDAFIYLHGEQCAADYFAQLGEKTETAA